MPALVRDEPVARTAIAPLHAWTVITPGDLGQTGGHVAKHTDISACVRTLSSEPTTSGAPAAAMADGGTQPGSSTQEEISADAQDKSLGKDPKFLVGMAISVYQNSGARRRMRV